MNDATKAEMLAEIEEFVGIGHLQEGDVTIQDLMERLRCSATNARRHGDKMVARGHWLRTLVHNEQGYRVTVYRRVEA